VARNDITVKSTSKTIAKLTAALNKVQEHAYGLYSAMSLGCVDNCHLEHEAKLFLQDRLEFMQKERRKSFRRPSIAFSLGFSHGPILSNASLEFYNIEVKVLEEAFDDIETRYLLLSSA
jgi:hypothetical protein